jgi:hypothetical protein
MRAHILLKARPRLRRAAASHGRCGCRSWPRRWRAELLVLVPLLAVAAPHADVSWRDIESRIQYGFYTEDATALRGLQDTVAADESPDRMHGYYAALAAWRLAQLAARTPAAGHGLSAAQLAQRCVSAADAALSQSAEFAEALALRAACRATPLDGAGSQGMYAVHRAHRDLERAEQLAARNPRVLLVDALNDYQLSAGLGGNRERALVKTRQAVAAFDAERSATEALPGWGAAEAYLLLARNLLDHGEAVGARDALEHALLIAPEFGQARRLMAQITGG